MTTAQYAENAVHATLSTTTADTVQFWGAGRRLRVVNHDASNELYVRWQKTNEVQTITLTSFDAGDTIKFTWGGNESAALTMVSGADHSTDIRTLLASLPGLSFDNIRVRQTSASVYVVYFVNGLGHTDVSAITCTNGTGSATGAVAETVKGGSLVAVGQGRDCYTVPVSSSREFDVPVTENLVVSVVGSGNVYSVEAV